MYWLLSNYAQMLHPQGVQMMRKSLDSAHRIPTQTTLRLANFPILDNLGTCEQWAHKEHAYGLFPQSAGFGGFEKIKNLYLLHPYLPLCVV